MSSSLAELSLGTFEPLVNARFVVQVAQAPVELELIEAKSLGNATAARRAPFSLIFRGPSEPVFKQGTYPLEHATLGQHGIFLVPIGREQDGARYQAIFA